MLCYAGSQVPLSLSAEAARNLRLMEERSLQAERMCDSALKVTSSPNPHCQPASHAPIRPSHSELGVAELYATGYCPHALPKQVRCYAVETAQPKPKPQKKKRVPWSPAMEGL
eukprot:COSAG01_NODE_1235_length_11106_cov_3.058962_9_plen_113_part_00